MGTFTVGGVQGVSVSAGGGTSPDEAKASVLAGSIQTVARLNADLLTRYNNAVVNYNVNMASGEVIPEDRRQPPVPPMAWELAPANADGYVFYQVGNTPIAAQAPAAYYAGIGIDAEKAARPANVTDIGHATGNPGIFSVGPNDTQPTGFQVTIPGTNPPVVLIKHAYGPFGYFYEQISGAVN